MSFFAVRMTQSDLAYLNSTLQGLAFKSNGKSAGNNFCQELCMIVPRGEGGSGDQTKVNPQCDDLRRVLAALKEEERSPPESKPLVIPRCGRLLFSGCFDPRTAKSGVVWSNLVFWSRKPDIKPAIFSSTSVSILSWQSGP